jgi:hypothetical protein
MLPLRREELAAHHRHLRRQRGAGTCFVKGYFANGVRVKDADAVAAATRLLRVQLGDRDFDPGDSLASMRRSGC